MTLRILIALALAFPLPAAAQTPRIAVLDFTQISQNYTTSKARLEELKAEETRIKADLAKEFAAYKTLIDNAKQLEQQFNDAASNSQLRDAKLKEARELFAKAQGEARRLQGVKQEKELAYQKRYAETTNAILAEIQTAATAFAREKGIDILIDRTGGTRNASPLVQFADDNIDVTQEFLARLNQQAAAAPKPAP